MPLGHIANWTKEECGTPLCTSSQLINFHSSICQRICQLPLRLADVHTYAYNPYFETSFLNPGSKHLLNLRFIWCVNFHLRIFASKQLYHRSPCELRIPILSFVFTDKLRTRLLHFTVSVIRRTRIYLALPNDQYTLKIFFSFVLHSSHIAWPAYNLSRRQFHLFNWNTYH